MKYLGTLYLKAFFPKEIVFFAFPVRNILEEMIINSTILLDLNLVMDT